MLIGFENNVTPDLQRLKACWSPLARALKIISKSIVMKKMISLLLTVTASLCFSSVNGQTAIGAKAGVNVANLSGDAHDPRVSVHGGFFVNRSISKNFSVQPELLFSGEGVKYVWAGVRHKWVLNYIQVPVMLQYYPVSQVYVEAGPQVGFLISAKDKLGEDSHANLKENINDVQFAIGAGLGIKVTDRIVIYGRYNFGLSDITSSYYDVFEMRSNVGQIGIAARFHQ